MLKKARSFREKLKKGALSKNTSRAANPSKHATQWRDKQKDDVDGRINGQVEANTSNRTGGDLPVTNADTNKNTGVKKIETARKLVQQSIKFINFAIERSKTVILPGSATVTLETTLELNTLITNILSHADPSVSEELSFHMNDVYRQLSEFIKWADHIMLLDEDSKLDTAHAKVVISSLEVSIDKLVQFSSDKVSLLSLPSPDSPDNINSMTLPKSRLKHSDSVTRAKRNSLPEVPLTPREQTILRETSMGAFDNPLALRQDSNISQHEEQPSNQNEEREETPPPKPFLPKGFSLRNVLSRSTSVDQGYSLPEIHVSTQRNSQPLPFTHYEPPIVQSSRSCHMFYQRNSTESGQLSPIQTQYMNDGTQPNIDDISLQIDRLAHGMNSLPSSSENSIRRDLTLPVQSEAPPIPGHNGAPPLPAKTRTRIGSDYDNVIDEVDSVPYNSISRLSSPGWSSSSFLHAQYSPAHNLHSLINMTTGRMNFNPGQLKNSRSMSNTQHLSHSSLLKASSGRSSAGGSINSISSNQIIGDMLSTPPPLPPKQRHVESYMFMFNNDESDPQVENYYSPLPSEYIASNRQFYRGLQEQYERDLFFGGNFPPYPEQRHYNDTSNNASRSASQDELADSQSVESNSHSANYSQDSFSAVTSTSIQSHNNRNSLHSYREDDSMSQVSDRSSGDYSEISPLNDVDVRIHLVRCDDINEKLNNSNPPSKRNSRALPDLKGGSLDALIVYATHVGKHDFMYQEAFLTTYRTFITPSELINKLLYRYRRFADDVAVPDRSIRKHDEMSRKRISRNAFSLLVRVVDELTTVELDTEVSAVLLELVVELIRNGELTLAKIMRKKVLEKCDPAQRPVESLTIVQPKSPMRSTSLVDFKAQEIAEQMTLLNNDFYQKLELPELLTWSEEQNDEKCPNLVKFTENFNKISWWCKTIVLKQEDSAIREKYFIKLVHALKYLRKHNNFNSLLAVLSALDSAPISRLDWPKQEKDMIQEFSSLIDSTSNFKYYRLALAEAEPPCIPYIGMILNDMTFIRVGNQNNLPDGNINFQMRWNLFNVLECLRRFRKPAYSFKKDQNVLSFLDNFNDFNSNDDEHWSRSKEIKPTAVK